MSVVIHGLPVLVSWSFSSACEYLVCGHWLPATPISAKPICPPFQFGLVRMLPANSGSGSSHECWGAWLVMRVASGQKSLSMHMSAVFRSLGTSW